MARRILLGASWTWSETRGCLPIAGITSSLLLMPVLGLLWFVTDLPLGMRAGLALLASTPPAVGASTALVSHAGGDVQMCKMVGSIAIALARTLAASRAAERWTPHSRALWHAWRRSMAHATSQSTAVEPCCRAPAAAGHGALTTSAGRGPCRRWERVRKHFAGPCGPRATAASSRQFSAAGARRLAPESHRNSEKLRNADPSRFSSAALHLTPRTARHGSM